MTAPLVFDVGLHKGEDTDFYLKKGYRVVAFEADPELVQSCRERFHRELEDGQLEIVSGAIASESFGDSVTFYRSSTSVWGTIDTNWRDRNALLGASSMPITVPRIDMLSVLRRYDFPHYIKIDIEGVDRHVLGCLMQIGASPQYLSIESEKVDFAKLEEEIDLLRKLGYRKFKAVQQAVPRRSIKTRTLTGEEFKYTFEQHASGPFGDDIAQPWLSPEDVLTQYRSIYRQYRRFGDRSKWQYNEMTKKALKLLSSAIRRPLPGWYDTHVSL